jgi:hypothetical protein
MTNPFIRKAHRGSTSLLEQSAPKAHQIETDFCTGKCRFVLQCRCGAVHETRYIDEALEWIELHKELAELSDQLPE